MTITYPLSFPSVAQCGINAIQIGLQEANSLSTSPFDFSQQVYQFQGQVWTVSASLAPMFRADADTYSAFFKKLRGKYGTFLLGDPAGASPRGSWGGTPLVNGASQTGTSLAVDGVTVGGTAKAGDYFQLGSGSSSRLYQIVTDAIANGSGQITLEFEPAIITAPADNAAVTISNAVGLFRLTDNIIKPSINSSGHYSFSFNAIGVP